jgi:hypothetical protein
MMQKRIYKNRINSSINLLLWIPFGILFSKRLSWIYDTFSSLTRSSWMMHLMSNFTRTSALYQCVIISVTDFRGCINLSRCVLQTARSDWLTSKNSSIRWYEFRVPLHLFPQFQYPRSKNQPVRSSKIVPLILYDLTRSDINRMNRFLHDHDVM